MQRCNGLEITALDGGHDRAPKHGVERSTVILDPLQPGPLGDWHERAQRIDGATNLVNPHPVVVEVRVGHLDDRVRLMRVLLAYCGRERVALIDRALVHAHPVHQT